MLQGCQDSSGRTLGQAKTMTVVSKNRRAKASNTRHSTHKRANHGIALYSIAKAHQAQK